MNAWGYGKPGFVIPHSGRIIKVKMKTPIYKESLKDLFIIRDRVDLDFTGNGFFSFINHRNSGEMASYIGVIRCREAYKIYFKKDDSDEEKFIGYDFCFDDDLPIFDPWVKEGDVINIKTLIDLEFPRDEDKNLVLEYGWEHVLNFPFFKNIYLVTFLIELDLL